MAVSQSVADVKAELAQVSSKTTSKDGDIAFHLHLPEDGLALHSASIGKDGLPELSFRASPNVPTLQEEDIATVFRLVAEKKRPEFFYITIPPTHPLWGRKFMQYRPSWLRGTSVGSTLAEADWKMKCVSIGARSNEEKTNFESWSHSSQLKGLATGFDFPRDADSGSIIMSCEYATVQKNDRKIVFPEEPKMKIKDDTSPSYSAYISKHYQSIAYHDEPTFLQVQELIKLILAVEWLYKEKGIRVDQEWVKLHTSKDGVKQLEAVTREKPPYEMIPKPSSVEHPCSDLSVVTQESERREFLGAERRFGYYDFGGAEVIIFKEDGTKCPPIKCLKFYCEQHDNILLSKKGWLYIPLPEQVQTSKLVGAGRDLFLKLVKGSCQEITYPLPASVDTTVKDSSDDSGMRMEFTESYRFHPSLALPPLKRTTVIAMTENNHDKLFASEDPNTPIPSQRGDLIPNVNSWSELISELTVPAPSVWLAPFDGFKISMFNGGVTTSSFSVREKPLPKCAVVKETMRESHYRRDESLLVARSIHVTAQGNIKSVDSCKFAEISAEFHRGWVKKGTPPRIISAFKIENRTLQQKWENYRQTLKEKNSEMHFHGTRFKCDIITTKTLCCNGGCGVCGISCAGMDPKYMEEGLKRFGAGYYLAPNSSKADDYTDKNSFGHKAVLLCNVLPGRKFDATCNGATIQGPLPGYDSVCDTEIAVYNAAAVLPLYIIVYSTR